MSEIADDFHLIRTKLNRPRVPNSFVPREALFARLSAAAGVPLILVAAPAGYGKSTIISAWLERWDGANSWLALDERDSDLFSFVTYFLAAIHNIFPQACEETSSLLTATTSPPVPIIATSLINGLNEINQHFVLVLDDFQAIHDPDVHELLRMLLRYPPASMQLVLISRRDPALPLPRLRSKGQMSEIRMQDLRFSTDEVSALVEQLGSAKVDGATVAALEKETEGWAVGLMLAILSRRHFGLAGDLTTKVQGTNAYVTDFLISEVLVDQSPDLETFLVKTSILDRLCASLCDAVIGIDKSEGGAQSYLDAAVDANLFIDSLDHEGKWFRFHYLFQQVLQQRLQKQAADEIAALHIRASDWFAVNGFIEEALQHALEADDTPRAVRLVSEHRHALMNLERWQHLERWLGLFSSSTIEVEPELLLVEAWIKQVKWSLANMPLMLASICRALIRPASVPEDDALRSLQAEIDTLSGLELLRSSESKVALASLERALSTLPQSHYYVRGYASILAGCAYQMAGDLNGAITLAADGLNETPKNVLFQTRLLTMLSLVYWMEGALDNLGQAATRILRLSHGERSRPGWVHGHHYLGCVQYHRNNLTDAEHSFGVVVDRPYHSYGFTLTHASFGLALTYQSQGRSDKAVCVIDSLVDLFLDTNNTTLMPVAHAFQAELALRQGRLAEADQWASRADTFHNDTFMPGFYAPQLTLPKILLAQDTVQSRSQAANYFSKLHDFVRSIHNTRFLIEVLALQALLHQAQDEGSVALDLLTQAIVLAQPGGFIRLFVNLGPKIKPLLAQLAQSGVASAYIGQILVAFDSTHGEEKAVSIGEGAQRSLRPSESRPYLLETLTNREIDVLLLLAERLTNKEIAQKLGISTETVKQHTANLYGKLHVNNRRQAVAEARALGILPPL